MKINKKNLVSIFTALNIFCISLFSVNAQVANISKITENNENNSFSYTIDSNENIEFNTRHAIEKITCQNDEKTLENGFDCFISENSISLFSEFLKTLGIGNHTFKIYYTNSSQEIFSVKIENSIILSSKIPNNFTGYQVPAPENKNIVFLSPSSQQSNMYWGNLGSEEYWCNLIADKVQNILEKNNIIVYRNNPELNAIDHITLSNSKNALIHMPIHTNAYNGKIQGAESFVHTFETKSHNLAKLIYNPLAAASPAEKDRGIKEHKKFTEIIKSNAQATNYIEISFHDNQTDATWIVNNTDKIASIIAGGILDYLKNNTAKY